MASKLDCLQSSVHYCYHCYRWVVGDGDWEDHCRVHLEALGSKRCGTITYCQTLVRPAFSPFQLWGKSLKPSQHMQSWNRDLALWNHVETYLACEDWPMSCPCEECEVISPDRTSLEYHFIDDHGFSKARPSLKRDQAKETLERVACASPPRELETRGRKRKRKAENEDQPLQWVQVHSPAASKAPGGEKAAKRFSCTSARVPAPELERSGSQKSVATPTHWPYTDPFVVAH
jgi:hypothetical protein